MRTHGTVDMIYHVSPHTLCSVYHCTSTVPPECAHCCTCTLHRSVRAQLVRACVGVIRQPHVHVHVHTQRTQQHMCYTNRTALFLLYDWLPVRYAFSHACWVYACSVTLCAYVRCVCMIMLSACLRMRAIACDMYASSCVSACVRHGPHTNVRTRACMA